MRNALTTAAIAALLTAGSGPSAYAGTATGGTVTELLPANSASYTFVYSVAKVGTTGCGVGQPNRWSIDITTSAGQAIVATLITAYVNNKNISIVGTNACIPSQPTIETVDHLVVSG
jgi:hypothetical protein